MIVQRRLKLKDLTQHVGLLVGFIQCAHGYILLLSNRRFRQRLDPSLEPAKNGIAMKQWRWGSPLFAVMCG
jgi:hypothetical protein